VVYDFCFFFSVAFPQINLCISHCWCDFDLKEMRAYW